VDVNLMTSTLPDDLLGEAVTVYQAAFGQPPYGETAEMAAEFAERVRRYARERDGFRFVTARSDGGQLIALADAARAASVLGHGPRAVTAQSRPPPSARARAARYSVARPAAGWQAHAT
jgi:hypothetical protein